MNKVETLPVVRQNPAERHQLLVDLEIPANKEAFIQLNGDSREVIKVYTNRSVHRGKVGKGAILIKQGKED
jgi:hypothetical protein